MSGKPLPILHVIVYIILKADSTASTFISSRYVIQRSLQNQLFFYSDVFRNIKLTFLIQFVFKVDLKPYLYLMCKPRFLTDHVYQTFSTNFHNLHNCHTFFFTKMRLPNFVSTIFCLPTGCFWTHDPDFRMNMTKYEILSDFLINYVACHYIKLQKLNFQIQQTHPQHLKIIFDVVNTHYVVPFL